MEFEHAAGPHVCVEATPDSGQRGRWREKREGPSLIITFLTEIWKKPRTLNLNTADLCASIFVKADGSHLRKVVFLLC